MRYKVIILLFLGMLSLQAQTKKATTAKKPAVAAKKKTLAPVTAATADGLFAEFDTSKGKITVALEYEKTPITVANFVSLAEGKNTFITDEKLRGKPYYDGLKFHRVIKDFMIQGGDPLGNGSGGTGYSFKDEIVPDLNHSGPGVLSMANSGPATNSSQFFITHKETAWLNGKHTVFGHVISGMDVVNAIVQDDKINKVTIIRKGASAKNFEAEKIFSAYFANKAGDDKKQAEMQAENRKKQAAADAEAKRIYDEKYSPVKADKVKYLASVRSTATKLPSGLESKTVKQGTGKKPAEGATFYIHYAGYLEDGSLFDSSYEDVVKAYGKFDQNRAAQNGYSPFPFQAGKKEGLIPGFLEGVNNMSFGEKAVLFIPTNLGYGAKGAGGVIPPNANIIFEVEIFETLPNPAPATMQKQ